MGRRIDNLDLKATPDLTDYILGYRPGEKGIRFTVSGLASAIGGGGGGSGTVTSVQADGGTTGLTFSGGPITSSGTLTLSGTLAIENGGTGATDAVTALSNLGAAPEVHSQPYTTIQSVPTSKLMGRYSAGTGTMQGITLGAGLSLSGGGTLDVTTLGTVTSVNASGGSTGLSFSGGPITGSGTLTLSGTLAVANGGTGATDASTARSNLGAAAATHSHSASDVTSGTLAVARGGTGQGTAAAAFDALAPTTTRGDLITRGASSNGRLAAGKLGARLVIGNTSGDPAWGDNAVLWQHCEEFIRGAVPGSSDTGIVIGAGTPTSPSLIASEAAAQGIIQLTTGNTSTGNCRWAFGTATSLRFGTHTFVCEARIRLTALSDGTNTFTFRIGFLDTSSGAAVDGAYLDYTHSANSGQWVAKCYSNSTPTTSNTSVAPAANTWTTVRIVVGTSSADFYVDDTLVASAVGGIPTGSGRETSFRCVIESSASTNAKTADTDWACLTVLK